MDFVTLASAEAYATGAGHRLLLSQNAEEQDADDDFRHLSGGGSSSSHPPLAARTEISAGAAATGVTAGQQRPLLSPAAEGELFLLATNFLLYVAMVIIITMVARIYFPESLERGHRTTVSRSVSYRRVENRGSPAKNAGSDDGADDPPSNSDDSDDNDDEYDETEKLIDLEGDGKMTKKGKKKKLQKQQPRERKERSGSFHMEFESSNDTSRTAVMKRLMFCAIMLNFTFVTWGVLQERMLTRRYPRFTGEYFTYSYALVFTNRFWTLIMSGLLLLYLKPNRSKGTVIYEYSFPSISNMLSSWCQYEALRYVSFPAATLFKSFKLAPVMAMGKILGNKAYPQYDYVVALVIGVGIAMFMSSTDDLDFGYDIYGEKTSQTWTGIMMLCLYLFFDSFTGQWQSRMFQRHRDLSMIELLFATSAFSTALSFVTLVHTHEVGPALNFVYRHSEIHLHFFLFSICSTIGQLTIFYTIKNFGAVVFSIIMTLRVLFSIALSCIMYGHPVTSTGFLGLMTVIGAVIYRVKRKAEGSQLIKWQGMGDEKAEELVREWHEHLDM